MHYKRSQISKHNDVLFIYTVYNIYITTVPYIYWNIFKFYLLLLALFKGNEQAVFSNSGHNVKKILGKSSLVNAPYIVYNICVETVPFNLWI